MTSWDFFDTLCGRACGDPWRVFDLVAGEDYRRVRQEAERRSDKTWPGIFRAVADVTGWTKARVEDLERREWDAEVAGAFPIVENVRRVKAGDVIVTDTYFDDRQIRQLATKIGIPAGVRIVRSWDDKWSGRWWQSPQSAAAGLHIGDNPRSDFANPRQHGRPAELYRAGAKNRHELEAEKAGQWETAGAMRAARLQCPYAAGSPQAVIWDGAASLNVRFLILAAALVKEYVLAAKPRRVFFVSRDAILLGEAYRRLYAEDVGIFHASRETLRRPTESFKKYAADLAEGSLFVDLHGTGRTVRQFCQTTGIQLAYVFVCGPRRMLPEFTRLVDLRGIPAGTAVEVMNYHDEGRVIDVVGSKPVRAPLEYDVETVRIHQAATLCGISAACRPPARVSPAEVADAAVAISRGVPGHLLRQHEVEHRSSVSPTRPAAASAADAARSRAARR